MRSLMILITKLVVNGLALVVVASTFPHVWLDSWQSTVAAALLLAVVNAYLRPVVLLLTLPINLLTLGLFTLVVNALMLLLVSRLIPGFHLTGFWTAVGAALVISVVSFLLSAFLKPPRVHVHVRRG